MGGSRAGQNSYVGRVKEATRPTLEVGTWDSSPFGPSKKNTGNGGAGPGAEESAWEMGSGDVLGVWRLGRRDVMHAFKYSLTGSDER